MYIKETHKKKATVLVEGIWIMFFSKTETVLALLQEQGKAGEDKSWRINVLKADAL